MKIPSTVQNILSTLSPDPRIARRRAVEVREAAMALPSVSSAGRRPHGTLSGKALILPLAVGVLSLATAAPAATALEATPFPAAQLVVLFAILIGLTVVVMILILGQSRVAFAMSRDNLLPLWFSRVHSRFRTPYRITFITGAVAALLAFWLPLVTLGELVNIGTLAAFVLVSIGIMVLRHTRPDLPRAFKVPGYPVVPILAALSCFLLMGFLTLGTWVRFFVWMAVGLVVYFAYSRGHSRLARGESVGQVTGEEV